MTEQTVNSDKVSYSILFKTSSELGEWTLLVQPDRYNSKQKPSIGLSLMTNHCFEIETISLS